MRKLILFFSLVSMVSHAQENTLKSAFTHGKVSGYVRSFYMSTHNAPNLTNWNQWAVGGKLKYTTQRYKGFALSAAFYSSINTGVGNVPLQDPSTGKYSRYELSMFDVNNPNKREIALLGEANLSYVYKKHKITAGRYKVKTPLLNPQDGWMIPTLQTGVWYTYQASKKLRFDAHYISEISPRGTSEFATVANSFGTYGQGRNVDGSKGNYNGNITTNGLWVAAMNYKTESKGIAVHNYLVDNVFNTVFVQPYVSFQKNKVRHTLSAQAVWQQRVNNGGNHDVTKAYFQQAQSQVYGLQYKLKPAKTWQVEANYNYVTAHGRFVFPREWGREFLFTFQRRERLEGMANTDAWMVRAKKAFPLKKQGAITTTLGYGQYYRPDVKQVADNKYALPANDQLNVDITWNSHKDKSGINVSLWMAYKGAMGETYNNPNFTLNKVNMVNTNFVVNYVF